MANSWHVDWLKEGVANWNKRRKRVSFEPDLAGLNFFEVLPPDFRDEPKTSRYFEKIDLSGANLRGADLSRLNFSRAKFDHAQLSEADLTRSNFEQAKFVGADLSGVSFEGSYLTSVEFELSNLTETSFAGADCDQITVIGIQLTSTQRNQIGPQAVREYSSRALYRKAMYLEPSTRYSRTAAVADEAVVADEKDERTKKNAYEVFFGTTRNPIFRQGKIDDFGTEQGSSTRYGIAKVIVPEGHRLGGIGRRLWRSLLNKKSTSLRLEDLMALNSDLFFLTLSEVSRAGGRNQRPTIFVHGFNTSFEAAVLRAAQFGHDLGVAQGIGLFSWPSMGKKRGYASDEAAAERNKYALSEFIEGFVDAFPENGVNLVAHSMGCRCLLGAIENLESRNPKAAKSIHQVILAAADVDVGIMPRQGTFAVSSADRATSYVGDKDIALRLSGLLHGFDRVGLVPPAFTMPGLDTVLVNDTDLGPLAHGYIAQSRAVLADIHALLSSNDPPEIRFSLGEHVIGGTRIWKIAD
ncbi:Secreted effector protein PipB [Shimia sp. SK013]|uniref:alpha/beta hydrolase n=1 Tax=Shimia sp. SK013 TaxID=1389006 RepID=UPI0006B4E08D|nr:alpha/beta hydrolase [Shimia sp. SK013]KPA20826.1 Secreted effector protein PipB [Shimia sp. SK013]